MGVSPFNSHTFDSKLCSKCRVSGRPHCSHTCAAAEPEITAIVRQKSYPHHYSFDSHPPERSSMSWHPPRHWHSHSRRTVSSTSDVSTESESSASTHSSNSLYASLSTTLMSTPGTPGSVTQPVDTEQPSLEKETLLTNGPHEYAHTAPTRASKDGCADPNASSSTSTTSSPFPDLAQGIVKIRILPYQNVSSSGDDYFEALDTKQPAYCPDYLLCVESEADSLLNSRLRPPSPTTDKQTCLGSSSEAAELIYLAEGGANVLFRLFTAHHTLAGSTQLLRVRKSACFHSGGNKQMEKADTGQPKAQKAPPPADSTALDLMNHINDTICGTAAIPTNWIVPHRLVAMSKHLVETLNHLLQVMEKVPQQDQPKAPTEKPSSVIATESKATEGASLCGTMHRLLRRPSNRVGTYLDTASYRIKQTEDRAIGLTVQQAFPATAVFVQDYSPTPTIFGLHFKPKWLSQSPSAPNGSRRCRTCALQALRRQKAANNKEQKRAELGKVSIRDRRPSLVGMMPMPPMVSSLLGIADGLSLGPGLAVSLSRRWGLGLAALAGMGMGASQVEPQALLGSGAKTPRPDQSSEILLSRRRCPLSLLSPERSLVRDEVQRLVMQQKPLRSLLCALVRGFETSQFSVTESCVCQTKKGKADDCGTAEHRTEAKVAGLPEGSNSASTCATTSTIATAPTPTALLDSIINVLTDYFHSGKGREMLLLLRDLQCRLDPSGALEVVSRGLASKEGLERSGGYSQELLDLQLAMTLRDCSVFVRVYPLSATPTASEASTPIYSAQPSPQEVQWHVTARLADLDYKDITAKASYWRDLEEEMVSEGVYAPHNGPEDDADEHDYELEEEDDEVCILWD